MGHKHRHEFLTATEARKMLDRAVARADKLESDGLYESNRQIIVWLEGVIEASEMRGRV